MNDLFLSCSALKTLDISSFSTKNVTGLSRMFESCSSLEALDLSNFDLRYVLYFSRTSSCQLIR